MQDTNVINHLTELKENSARGSNVENNQIEQKTVRKGRTYQKVKEKS